MQKDCLLEQDPVRIIGLFYNIRLCGVAQCSGRGCQAGLYDQVECGIRGGAGNAGDLLHAGDGIISL